MKKEDMIKFIAICLFTFLIILHFKKLKLDCIEPINHNLVEVVEEKNANKSVNPNSLFVGMSKETDVLNLSKENIIKEGVITVEVETETAVEETKQVDNYVDMETPPNNQFKAYMDYRLITDQTSDQWKLQQYAYTDEYTGLRMIDDKICIAVGSYYTTKIGTQIDLIMENGEIIKCILADCKSDQHTDSETHRANPNGCIAEFVVDQNILIPHLQTPYGGTGNVSDLAPRFNGEIKYIRIYS